MERFRGKWVSAMLPKNAPCYNFLLNRNVQFPSTNPTSCFGELDGWGWCWWVITRRLFHFLPSQVALLLQLRRRRRDCEGWFSLLETSIPQVGELSGSEDDAAVRETSRCSPLRLEVLFSSGLWPRSVGASRSLTESTWTFLEPDRRRRRQKQQRGHCWE